MRAVVLTGHGGPEVLQAQDRPDPAVGPGQVGIDVKAAGINFADTLALVEECDLSFLHVFPYSERPGTPQ